MTEILQPRVGQINRKNEGVGGVISTFALRTLYFFLGRDPKEKRDSDAAGRICQYICLRSPW